MRKIICFLVALLLCASMAFPAFAATGEFVPSISYKPSPKVSNATMLSEDGTETPVGSCIVVTSVEEARDQVTDITQEERDLLVDVYQKLVKGDMTLPVEKNYIIRELVDVSFAYSACRTQEDHGHKDQKLKEEGVVLTMNFDLNLGKKVNVDVLTYIDGEWKPIEKVTNNGDGTVTCVFEDICPVAFVVDETSSTLSPNTGDAMGQKLGLWIGLMAVSAVALVAVVVMIRKKRT